MKRALRSLRVQLALVGFLAIYLPVLLLFGVTVTEEQTEEVRDGVVVSSTTPTRRSPWTIGTVIALGPVAAGLAWWWAGRAMGPIERAAQSQRQLIEEISHELRTPLSVLTTNADVLLAHPDPTVELYRQGLVRSRAAAARLQATIDELLVDARGRARTLDRLPADLTAIAGAVVDDALVATPKQIKVTLTGPPTAVCALDEATVRRALSNLVDNAIRYAPAGTTVEVDVDVDATNARVAVTDHGPGIPPDQQDHIFERFWRGRRETRGTGLGLPIARQIALAHGGNLTVMSPGPAGDGCVFELTLHR